MSALRCVRTPGPHALAALLLIALTGCASVPPRPLHPDALLSTVRAERDSLPADHALDLAAATAAMQRNNPAIREARAEWRTAAAVARTKTPLPNPSIEFTSILFGGADILSSAAWAGFEAAFGWTVLLGRTRTLEDRLHVVEREAAFARAAAVEREEYLALRRAFALAALERRRLAAHEELVDAARAAVEVGRRMAEAGQASALDVHLLDLDARRAAADHLEADGDAEAARHALAARIGVSASAPLAPADAAVAPLPDAVPTRDALVEAIAQHHPHLAVLRAEYLVAEKALRLEVGRGVPTLDIGATWEHEGEENRIGLPLGIEIPIFDRNQVEIARACAERDAVRARYTATLHRLLSATEMAHARLLSRQRRLDALTSDVSPASEATLQAAKAGLEAGSSDALSYLAALRAERDVALDLLTARIDVYDAWADLEEAAGVPLLDFPTFEFETEPPPAPTRPPPASANDTEGANR